MKVLRVLCKLLMKLALILLLAFLVTFGIYLFNVENKLIYRFVYPFLQKHYDSQTRDRRV